MSDDEKDQKMSDEEKHQKFANYVKEQFIQRITHLEGIYYDETEEILLKTTKADMMFHIKDTDIYIRLEQVILKFYNQVEKIKHVFCQDKTLNILLVNAIPIISKENDDHQMRMLIVVSPQY